MSFFYYCINIFGQICLFFLILFALIPLCPSYLPLALPPSDLVGYLAQPCPLCFPPMFPPKYVDKLFYLWGLPIPLCMYGGYVYLFVYIYILIDRQRQTDRETLETID